MIKEKINNIDNKIEDIGYALREKGVSKTKQFTFPTDGSFISDTAEGEIRGLKICGDIKQESRSGKNKLPISKKGTYTVSGITFTAYYKGKDLIKINIKGTSTADINYDLIGTYSTTDIILQPNTSYTFCLNATDTSGIIRLACYNARTVKHYYTNVAGEDKTFTVGSVGITSVYLQFPVNNTYDVDIYPMVILSNETDKTYEPYGVSPSIDYPSEIGTVSGNYDVKTISKNVLDMEELDSSKWTFRATYSEIINTENDLIFKFKIDNNFNYTMSCKVPIKVEKGKTYTISYEAELENTATTALNLLNLSDTEPTLTGSLPSRKTITASSDTAWAYMLLSHPANGGISKATISNIQLEENIEATNYVPHNKDEKKIDTSSNPLYSQNDYYYQENGEWYVHNEWAEKIFDGVTNKFLSRHASLTTDTKGFYIFDINGKIKTPPSGSVGYGFCNYGKFLNILSASVAFNTNDEGLWWEGGTAYSYFILPKTTLASANQWLVDLNNEGKPLKIWYALGTPINTKITNETLINQLNDLSKLKTYDGGTNIVITSEDIPPIIEIQYAEKDSKFKLSEMPQAILDIPKGIDTSDATAVSDDILMGRIAYARATRIIGTYKENMSQEEYDYAIRLSNEILGDKKPESELPYILLEYIEGTGTQWIDTLFRPTNNTAVEFICSSLPYRDTPFMGAYTTWYSSSFLITTYDYGVHCYFDGEKYIQPNSNLVTHTIYASSTQFIVDGTSKSINNTVGRTDTNLTIFKGATKIGSYKLNGFKIYEANELIRDFVPVIEKATQKICMYDKVNNKFYYNSGSGNFVAGGVVNE